MDAQVVQLLDGIAGLNGDGPGIDVGVVVQGSTSLHATAIAVDVGGGCATNQLSVGCATRTDGDGVEHALDEHRHLLAGNVVIRNVSRSRHTSGDPSLSELIDRSLDFGRLAGNVSKALVCTRTKRHTGFVHGTCEVQSHLPARHRGGRLVGRSRSALGDAVVCDAVDVSACRVGETGRRNVCRGRARQKGRCRTNRNYSGRFWSRRNRRHGSKCRNQCGQHGYCREDADPTLEMGKHVSSIVVDRYPSCRPPQEKAAHSLP